MLESLRRNWELDILQQQLFSPFFPFAHFLLGDPMAARWQWQWRGQWQGSGGWGATGLGSWCHLLRKVCFPITPFQMRFSSLLLHSAFLSNPTVVIQLARRDLLRSICSPHPLKSTKSLSLSAFLLSRVSCTNGKQNSLTPWIPRDVDPRPLVARLNTEPGPRRIWRPQPSPLGWLIALMTGRAVNHPADIVGFTWNPPPAPAQIAIQRSFGEIALCKESPALASSYSRNEKRSFANLGTASDGNLLSTFRSSSGIWFELSDFPQHSGFCYLMFFLAIGDIWKETTIVTCLKIRFDKWPVFPLCRQQSWRSRWRLMGGWLEIIRTPGALRLPTLLWRLVPTANILTSPNNSQNCSST